MKKSRRPGLHGIARRKSVYNLKQVVRKTVIRQKGSRRMGLLAEFPLTDSEGLSVIQDRRTLPDRRKTERDIADLKAILSKTITDSPTRTN